MMGNGQRGGSAWIVVVVLAAVLVLLALIVVVPTDVGPWHSEEGVKMSCLSNVKNIALALLMYVQDSGDVYPPADGWCDTLGEYVKNDRVFQCPEALDLRCAFAYNRGLSGLRGSDVGRPQATVAVFESEAGWNAAGDANLLPVSPRHSGGDNYGFADGHAAWVTREDLARGGEGMAWSSGRTE